uniref:Uncharacterized protein n=1 Tax=Cacopsylla melanoneura TaxID=428564 RepID=A0A8D8UVQ3_9HEMI
MTTHQQLSETYNEVIEAREYAIYLIRLCLSRQMNILDPPNVSQWEWKMRQVDLTYEDCQKIKETNLYKCTPNETINAGSTYARNFLSAMQSTCNAVEPSIDWMYYVYIFLCVILILGVCLLLKLLIFHLLSIQNQRPTMKSTTRISRNKPPQPNIQFWNDKVRTPNQESRQSTIREEQTQCDCSGH